MTELLSGIGDYHNLCFEHIPLQHENTCDCRWHCESMRPNKTFGLATLANTCNNWNPVLPNYISIEKNILTENGFDIN